MSRRSIITTEEYEERNKSSPMGSEKNDRSVTDKNWRGSMINTSRAAGKFSLGQSK